jgi:hypothetical protein
MENEIWKKILLNELETKYEVSDKGNVKNAKFNKLLAQFTNANGHVYCCLYENKKQHNPYVHRLMAEAFLENPENFNVVNHKDGNKSNNVIENLEWGTQSYNVQHAHDTIGNKGNQREIVQYDGPDMKNIIKRFETVNEVANHFKKERTTISRYLNGKIANPIHIAYAVDKKTIHDKDDFEPIKDYTDYLIHKDSRIYSTKMNQFMSFQLRNGYQSVLLNDARLHVHQLVAIQFLLNPDNKPQVNHKDGNKLNNHVDNLEWATGSENQTHAFKTGLNNTVSAVKQYLLDGTFVREYNSIIEINKILGLKNSTISQCCRKITKQSYGFIWRYSSDTDKVEPITSKYTKPMIIQYTQDGGEFVSKYSSYKDICTKFDIDESSLQMYINSNVCFLTKYLFMSNIVSK